MHILVTGVAGFIGSHLAQQLLKRGDVVTGIDNLNDYYDVSLKKARLNLFSENKNFTFHKIDIADQEKINQIFDDNAFDVVVNLAAQAGVRYSIENPNVYIHSNLVGFCNILEACRYHSIKHLVYASSSSVYGANTQQPFSEMHHVDHPLSLYGATKKANELMAHSYANLYNLSCTGLRFFTVYGPWGRPDMALFKFTQKILNDEPIDIYNNGNMTRDFTYIDDIIDGTIKVIDNPAARDQAWNSNNPTPASSFAPYKIYNIGNNNPVKLMDFIEALEEALGKTAKKNLLPLQPGDVPSTFADISLLENTFNFKPKTSVPTGINEFVEWYCNYYNEIL